MDPVTAAIALGASAGLASTTSQAVRDAYNALKALISERFPRVDLGPIQELPNSKSKQAALAEDVDRSGAASDADIVRQAFAVLAAVAREAPQVAARIGVDLEHVKAEFVNIQRVDGGVTARDVTATGGVTITDVRAGGGPDPNR